MKTSLLATAALLMFLSTQAIGGVIDLSGVSVDGVTLGTYTTPGGNPVTITYSPYDPADTATAWQDAVTGSTFGDLIFQFARPIVRFQFDFVLDSPDGTPYDSLNNGDPQVSATISDGIDDFVAVTPVVDLSDPTFWFASGSFDYAATSGSFKAVTLDFFPIRDVNQQYEFTLTNLASTDAPEPASAALLGLGLVGIARFGLRRRRS